MRKVLLCVVILLVASRARASEPQTLVPTVIHNQKQTVEKSVESETQKSSTHPSSQSLSETNMMSLRRVICRQGEKIRTVEIKVSKENTAPCEVIYRKDTENPRSNQIIYHSQSNLKICEEKAQAFVTKIISWGWVCAEEKK